MGKVTIFRRPKSKKNGKSAKKGLFNPHCLRSWREHRRLSQTALADMAGLTHGTISQLETRKIGYTQVTVESLARALQCDPADLIGNPPGAMQKIIALLRNASEQEIEKIIIIAETIITKAEQAPHA